MTVCFRAVAEAAAATAPARAAAVAAAVAAAALTAAAADETKLTSDAFSAQFLHKSYGERKTVRCGPECESGINLIPEQPIGAWLHVVLAWKDIACLIVFLRTGGCHFLSLRWTNLDD